MPNNFDYREPPVIYELLTLGRVVFDFISPAGDLVAPVVTRITPAEAILSSTTPVVLSVADDLELRKVVIHARFADLALEEVVWNGERFASNYADNSRRLVDGLTQTFTLRRTPSWPSSPAVDVIAIDASGNETTP